MADTTLSAEAQAMVSEGMRLAKAVLSAGMHLGVSDKPTAAEIDLRAHLTRMAAMAAPQGEPVAWVDVVCTHQGPYNFHGMELLPTGKHALYTAPQPAAPAVPDEAELKFLDEWLTFATEPVGLQCCGRSRGGECCMDPEPTYPSRNEVIDAMAARHRELTAMLAAAPDLLEALQELIAEYDPQMAAMRAVSPRHPKWRAARAAIAKATGGEA